MAKPKNIKSCKKLEQLLNEYAEQIQELCRLNDIHPKRNKGPKKRIKDAAKELKELMKTEDQSFDVSSILSNIESATEMIKKTIEELESDSDPVQPCSVRSMPRVLCDTKKKMIASGAVKHDHKMMRFMKDLKKTQKPFPAIQKLFQEETSYKLRTAYNKMGIDTKGCETCELEDDSEWEVKRPSEVKTEANIKYSVSSSAGQYECSETGLRWRSDSDVSLEYQFVDWESLHEDIMKNYKPCGPLMDITVTSGTLEEIHLPHFICVDSVSSSDDAVKALHVNGSEASLERCELTRFHAKLLNPTFSLLGVIAHLHQYFTMKFHCETLIYRNKIAALNLHVYLILKDEKLKKDVKEKEKHNMEIVKPSPDEALKIDNCYTLKTSCDSEIKPANLQLTPCKANFFDLYIQDAKKPIELYIKTKEDKTIWEVNIGSDEFSINSPVSSHRQCQNCSSVRDSTEWDLIEPSVISEDAPNQKYRMNLASGCYECSRTGLRIECSHDIQLEYHICDWECVSDSLAMEPFTPCGPLMDIAIISGELKAVYLPHFLCLGSNRAKSGRGISGNERSGFLNEDEVRILHFEGSGIAFEKCKLTRFHAKLLDHTFSPKGVLLRSGFSVNYHCETLIYQTLKSHLTLHVYLIPSDKKMIEAVQENEADSKAIRKPGPESSLQMKTWFSLRTLEKMRKPDSNSEVIPEKIQLKYKPIKPNFFEVFIDAPKEDFYLQLMAQQHKVVWDVKIRQADYSQNVSSVDVRRESYSSNAVGNKTVHEILLEHLEYLTSDELKLFKWHLTEGVETFKKIPKCKLEKAERCNTVTCMIDQYEVDGAAKLTVMILKKMQKNNYVKQLQEELERHRLNSNHDDQEWI